MAEEIAKCVVCGVEASYVCSECSKYVCFDCTCWIKDNDGKTIGICLECYQQIRFKHK
ncbi:MAG: hypothetical protein QXZ70_04370 [Candidatus Bathyarchaeia archaeon]